MSQIENQRPRNNLSDFVVGVTDDSPLELQVSVKEDGRCVVFHDKPFKDDVSWFEFNLETNKLDFILEDGNVRDVGMPLKRTIAKHMQNSHQILMVLMDNETGEPKEGRYIPLIIHRSY